MSAKWIVIEGFSNYEISSSGGIRRIARVFLNKKKAKVSLREKVLTPRWNDTGKNYSIEIADNEGKRRTVYLHRLVAEAFVERRCVDETMIIRLDNDATNNDASNLKWVSGSEHMKYQFEVGNRDNKQMWITRKKRYGNGFKERVITGRSLKVSAD